MWKRVDQDGSGGLDRDELRTVLLSKTTRESPYGNGVLVLDSVLRSAGPSVLGNKPEEIDMDATMKAIDLDGSEVRDPHDPMDCNPTRWPLSPRIVMRCAPRASNGPDHLGRRALQAAVKPTVTITTTPGCEKFGTTSSNARKPWQGPVNCGVYGRAWREEAPPPPPGPPPPGWRVPFLCVHIAAVNPNPFPAVARFEVAPCTRPLH